MIASSRNLGLVIVLLLSQLTATVLAQSSPEYGRYWVEKLSDSSYTGRGFTDSGMARAAEAIAAEYERLGLQPLTSLQSFLQPFQVSVNYFPASQEVKIDGNLQNPGEAYHIVSSSPSTKGSFKIQYISWEPYQNDASGLLQTLNLKSRKARCIDLSKLDAAKESGAIDAAQHREFNRILALYLQSGKANAPLILLENKLTWALSQKQGEVLGLRFDKSFFPERARKIELNIEALFDPHFECHNVVGYLPASVETDSLLLISAHYDHLGTMGEALFPGANDNASGTALMMDLARKLEADRRAGNLPFGVLLIAFGAEELGLCGSRYFVDSEALELSKLKFQINLDICGTGEEGIQVVNGKVFREDFDRLQQLNTDLEALAQVKIRGERCNSDHCPFYERGVPAFFLYTLGGVRHYHDIYDRPGTLPLTEFEDLSDLLHRFILDFGN
jgi:hypothetical protein